MQDNEYFVPQTLMNKESYNLIRRGHILVNNMEVYVIHKEKEPLFPQDSINLSF